MNDAKHLESGSEVHIGGVGRFLAGIAALIWDSAMDKYLLLQRSQDKDYGSGAWECVTGRVDQGEDFETALHREVLEEIGAEVQIEFIIATTRFYRGEARPENELLGVLYGCTLKDPGQVTHGSEHSQARWFSAQEADDFLPERYWLRNIIERAEQMKAQLPEGLREVYRREGFNIG
ncbi:MAG: NUDIX domain-containing protein [Anaerolineales bacterium]|nr:NUDIX domain-containing protein [Anaerolineales bacterium]